MLALSLLQSGLRKRRRNRVNEDRRSATTGMIWADRVAIAVYALIAFGMALMFATSDASMREAAYRAKDAKFAEGCAVHVGHDLGAPDPLSLEPNSAPRDVQLPDSLCDDANVKAVRAADAAAFRAPTVTDLMLQIAEVGIFFIV